MSAGQIGNYSILLVFPFHQIALLFTVPCSSRLGFYFVYAFSITVIIHENDKRKVKGREKKMKRRVQLQNQALLIVRLINKKSRHVVVTRFKSRSNPTKRSKKKGGSLT